MTPERDDELGIGGPQLWIDGERVSPTAIRCHFQDDPFPGGSEFRLRIEGARLIEQFSFLLGGGVEVAERKTFERFCQRYGRVTYRRRVSEGEPESRWVLNKFTSLTIEETSIAPWSKGGRNRGTRRELRSTSRRRQPQSS